MKPTEEKMNRENIVRMAIQSQLMTTENCGGMYEDAICEFADLVASAEREACARVCEEFGKEWYCEDTTNQISATVRARGKSRCGERKTK